LKKLLFSLQFILAGLFIFSLLAMIFQLSGKYNPLTKFDYKEPAHDRVEEYDPSLSRLNSLKRLEQYCDSMYAEQSFNGNPVQFEQTYTDLVCSVVRKRFYHGYSYYGFENNYMAMLISKSTVKGFSAVIIPDDILAHPFAACSQQSIVMMEVLKSKGFKTRKVSFSGKEYGGHFSFEVFYNGAWHFYDPNLEPDVAVLNTYNKPSIEFLVRNPQILLKAYSKYPREEILDIFPKFTYGAINKFPAPRGIIFQKLTKFLSYTSWLLFLVSFFIVRRKYLQGKGKTSMLKARIYFPQTETGVSPSFSPGFTA
jgi:hypothetical protein